MTPVPRDDRATEAQEMVRDHLVVYLGTGGGGSSIATC